MYVCHPYLMRKEVQVAEDVVAAAAAAAAAAEGLRAILHGKNQRGRRQATVGGSSTSKVGALV